MKGGTAVELRFYHPEFEEAVRKQLGIFHRPLTQQDALQVTQLDLSDFDFLLDDWDTLSLFNNLKALYILAGHTKPAFWQSFVNMEELFLVCWGEEFDFSAFGNMKNLAELTVSGGDYSGIEYLNLEMLIPLKKLRRLVLHEFGSVDLLPLASMPQLKDFSLRYAKDVIHTHIIGTLSQLEKLTLDGLWVESLDFLDQLPDHIRLKMCGNHVYGGVDPKKWKRFAEHDISAISQKDQPFVYVDLSVLEP